MSLASGTRLGPYEVVAAIGAGGMGEVYRARDARLGRDVAIKVLPAGLSSDPDRLARFEQEARAAAALNHPNILAVYDIGTHDRAPYIVSELLEGETLREQVSGLAVRKAIDFAIQVAHGLAAAHEKGIVHRDLKPENIFITSDGRLKILDFGLAKLTQPEPAFAGASVLPTTPPQTLPGVVLGTIGYMSPEQVRGVAADHRADIFALGAILYEMLSGKRAFTGDTPMDAMTAILKEDPPALPIAARQIPAALERIVGRCLEKAPAARFKSADDLAFALEGLSGHSEAARASVGRVKPARREQLGWAAAAVFFVAAMALGAMTYLTRTAAGSAAPEMRLQIVTPAEANLTPNLTAFALSPDGTSLVYQARGQLWLRPLQSEVARPLPGTEGAIGPAIPFWSPDSRAVGFFTADQLKRIDISTGLVQALAAAPRAAGGTWSSEGTIMFAPSPASPLLRLGAGGGGRAEATRLEPSRHVGHRFPQFLPDGRHFIFLAMGTLENRGIYVGSLDSTETHRLFEADGPAVFAPPDRLLFARQGALLAQRLDLATLQMTGDPVPVATRVALNPGSFNALAASASASALLAYRANADERQLRWIDRAGRQISTVGAPDLAQTQPLRLSPDGSTLLVTRTVAGNSDVWLIDLERGVPRRFTFETVRDISAVWSPDGRQILFSSERTGVFDLYERPSDAAAPESLMLASSEPKTPEDWSPDGRFILYRVQDPKGDDDLWVLPLAGDRKPVSVTQTQFAESGGRFSPDGRWIAYQSDESGKTDIYVQPFPGPGGRLQVSTGGGSFAQWRRDGRELFYLGSDNQAMAVPVAPNGPTLKAGTPVRLFSVSAGGFIASPDGQRFLVSTVTADAAPITVLLNWAGLKRDAQ